MTFRLSTLLVVMSILAVGCFLLTAAPPLLAVPALVTTWLILAAWLLTGIVYGRGSWRAFSMGGMIPAGATVAALTLQLCSWLLVGAWEIENMKELTAYLDRAAFTYRVWSAGGWLLVVVLGAACTAGRAVSRLTDGDHSGD